MTDEDVPGHFERDVNLEKPGIVGARWWHKSLVDEDQKLARRQVLVAGGAIAALTMLGCCFSTAVVSAVGSDGPEPVSLASKNALEMQKRFGWDFGARGVALTFDGKAEVAFVRTELQTLAAVMSPRPDGPNAKHHVPTLVESLFATPFAALPDPGDGLPRPDHAPFHKLADVLMPIATPGMSDAYAAGEAVARHAAGKKGLALLADLPGPEAVAFAAGAASVFEPVLLLDNWPHPYGVVPSHRTLAALAYYQPRFAAAKKDRATTAPCFVIDRARLSPYAEAKDRFDNRYYARMPRLDVLEKDGVKQLFYVVSAPGALPEPADLTGAVTANASAEVRAIVLTQWTGEAGQAEKIVYYGGSPAHDGAFWIDYAPRPGNPTEPAAASAPPADYRFLARAAAAPAAVGLVPVITTATGIIISAALDRQGSMNRFGGGWSG